MAAPLSYDYLQAVSKIVGRSALSRAITHAIDQGYIACIERGVFDARIQYRRPASYAVRWLSSADVPRIGSKSVPADRFKNWTSIGSKSEPADRFKKRTKEKTQRKDILKQQQVHLVAAAVSLDQEDGFALLIAAGFDQAMASRLARTATRDEIARQIDWLPRRNPDTITLACFERRSRKSGQSRPLHRRRAPTSRDTSGTNNTRLPTSPPSRKSANDSVVARHCSRSGKSCHSIAEPRCITRQSSKHPATPSAGCCFAT